jgi:hypothetical protein
MSIIIGCAAYGAVVFTGTLLGTDPGPTTSLAFFSGAGTTMLLHWRRLRSDR